MSRHIELDPERTAPLEPPSEGDDRNRFWISPFEVPKKINLDCGAEPSEIRAVRFEYSGGETGEDWMPLDDRDEPAVQVRTGRITRKILELRFAPPIALEQLAGLGERLRRCSNFFRIKATAFNYRMIAAIFQNWKTVVEPTDAGVPSQEGDPIFSDNVISRAAGREEGSRLAPNLAALAILKHVRERQKARRETDPSRTQELIREARAGGMYGHEHNE